MVSDEKAGAKTDEMLAMRKPTQMQSIIIVWHVLKRVV